MLALQKGFYGEVLTTLYFTAMQPIGLLVWIYQAQFKKEQQEFVARKLDTVGWTKYLSISVLWWLAFGLIYQSIGANRPYRDSITDATNGVGQLLMTAVYREQWISGQLLMFSLSTSGGEKAFKFKGNTSFTSSTVWLVGTNGARQLRKLSTYVYQLIRGSRRVLFLSLFLLCRS